MTNTRVSQSHLIVGILAMLLVVVASGCVGTAPWRPAKWWSSWLDPSATIAASDVPEMTSIINSVDPADPYQELVPNAGPPTDADLYFTAEDYRLGPGDQLQIGVLDLFQPGVEAGIPLRITNAGYIRLPLLADQIDVEGLTIEELREEIIRRYQQADELIDPEVSVYLTGQRQNIYTILGAVGAPGPYQLFRRDYRVWDALAQAGDVTQANLKWLYVYRRTEAARALDLSKQASQPQTPETTGQEPLPPLPGQENGLPQAGEQPADDLRELQKYVPGGVPPAAPALPGEQERPSVIHMSDTRAIASALAGLALQAEEGSDEVWVRDEETGKWKSVPADQAGVAPRPAPSPTAPYPAPREQVFPPMPSPSPDLTPPSTAAEPDQPAAPVPPVVTPGQEPEYGWNTADMSNMTRIIAINIEELKQGNWRQNIVIKDQDMLIIPTHEVGEFYLTGEVNRPGVYNLTGRELTVKQAIAAGGDFTQLAWPSNSTLTRRTGPGQELTIQIRLDLIMAGKEPDILVKPNDVIAVGTHIAAPFMAVVRNAFRMTYGFGFIYDRNFAEKNFGQFNGFEDVISDLVQY